MCLPPQTCLVLNIFHTKTAFLHLVNPLTSSFESINHSAAEFLQLCVLEVGGWIPSHPGRWSSNALPVEQRTACLAASTLCHFQGLSPLGLPCLWVSYSDFNFFEHFPDLPTHQFVLPLLWLPWEKEFHFPCIDTASRVSKTAWDSASSANRSLQKGMSRKCHPWAACYLCPTAVSRLSSHSQWRTGHVGNLLPDVDNAPSGQRSDLSVQQDFLFFLNS